jgi:nitrous oxidase accessory protein NosD
MRKTTIAAMAAAAWGWAGANAGLVQVPADQTTIQAGIDAAQNGDTVLVADGIYTGEGNRNLDFGGKLLTVRSVNGPDGCIIDCEGSGRGFFFHNGETASSVVAGYTIQNGDVEWDGPGGGYGGGIHCSGSAPTITACRIRWNHAELDGGGIYCNWAASATVSACTITGNLAVIGYGGGICCYNGSDVVMTDCTISDNLAIAGSGMANFASSPTLTNCSLADNAASGGG